MTWPLYKRWMQVIFVGTYVRLLSLMFLKVLIITFKGCLDHLAIFSWCAIHVNVLIEIFILYVPWFITCTSSLSFYRFESLIMCGVWVHTPQKKHTHIRCNCISYYVYENFQFTAILFINICTIVFEMTLHVFICILQKLLLVYYNETDFTWGLIFSYWWLCIRIAGFCHMVL
jgi:hypothetical protein